MRWQVEQAQEPPQAPVRGGGVSVEVWESGGEEMDEGKQIGRNANDVGGRGEMGEEGLGGRNLPFRDLRLEQCP